MKCSVTVTTEGTNIEFNNINYKGCAQLKHCQSQLNVQYFEGVHVTCPSKLHLYLVQCKYFKQKSAM